MNSKMLTAKVATTVVDRWIVAADFSSLSGDLYGLVMYFVNYLCVEQTRDRTKDIHCSNNDSTESYKILPRYLMRAKLIGGTIRS